MGKDYVKIVFYLCCMSDFLFGIEDDDEVVIKEEEFFFYESLVFKGKKKKEVIEEFEEVFIIYELDEVMVREL